MPGFWKAGALVGAAALAFAVEAQARMAITLGAGQSTVKGDLTEQETASGPAFDLSLQFTLGPAGADSAGMIDLDFGTYASFEKAGDRFPFVPGEKLGVETSALMLAPCFFTDHLLNLCPAAGYAHVTVTQDEGYAQNYGGNAFGLYAGHVVGEGWIWFLKVIGVGVTQEVDKEKSGFTLINALASVGYSFDFEHWRGHD